MIKKHRDIDPFDEEIWDDEEDIFEKDPLFKFTHMLKLDDLEQLVNIEGDFRFIYNHNLNRLIHPNKMITFENMNEKTRFVRKFDGGMKKCRYVELKRVDKDGFIVSSTTLHGVSLACNYYDNVATIGFDYLDTMVL